MEITLIVGDITQQATDAIVNAANSTLLGGAGGRGDPPPWRPGHRGRVPDDPGHALPDGLPLARRSPRRRAICLPGG